MLKVLTSSCLQARFHNVRWTLNTNAHHTKEVNTPLHRHLGSLRGFNRKSSYIYRRIFCSDSSDASEYVAGAESGTEGKRVEVEGQESDSKSSAAMVPSVFRPEDYFTVLFVCTPNVVEMIPSPLLDRMEVISIAGYVTDEKMRTDAKMRTLYTRVSKPNDFLYNQFRLFSSSIPNCSTTYPFDKSQVSNLIAKQQWCKLRLIVNQTDPSHFLLQLFDSGTDSDTLVAYFKWSQREFQVSYTVDYYCKLFHLLAKDKKYPKIRALLHQFIKQGNNLNSSFFHALSISSDDFWVKSIIVDMLILTYAQNLKTDLAVEAFQRAGDYGYKLSALSCSPMLVALVKEGKFVLVEVVYKEMIRRRIKLNFIIFNTVINGLCKAGKLQKAGDVLEEMKIWGFSPSVVTYNTLISGHCKKGRVGKMYKANAILKEMVDKNITANEITYNILIDGFCKNENISGAMNVFREMQRQGLKPGVITYNSLINELCHNGKPDEALVLRDEMVDLGLMPTVVTYNVLINGFSKKKMLEKVRDLFDDIPRQGLVPCVVTFNTVIDAYCKEGKLEEAIALYNLMFDRKIFPNVSTYNCLVGGFLQEGNIEEAGKFLGKMEENGLKADVVTYNIRMDALCKKGEAREAAKLLDEMLEIGLSPSHITYNTLMAGYCWEGNLRAALNVRRRMEKERKRPNVVTYNVLIKGFCVKGKLKEANTFINELLEKGLCPNRTTYDIIREEMMEKGFVPDIDGHLCYESVDS